MVFCLSRKRFCARRFFSRVRVLRSRGGAAPPGPRPDVPAPAAPFVPWLLSLRLAEPPLWVALSREPCCVLCARPSVGKGKRPCPSKRPNSASSGMPSDGMQPVGSSPSGPGEKFSRNAANSPSRSCTLGGSVMAARDARAAGHSSKKRKTAERGCMGCLRFAQHATVQGGHACVQTKRPRGTASMHRAETRSPRVSRLLCFVLASLRALCCLRRVRTWRQILT